MTEQSFFIDMRAMNRILAVSPEERPITIKVVLADGQLVEASRSKNLELF